MSKSLCNVVRNNLHVKAKCIAQIVSHNIMSTTMFRMVIRLFAGRIHYLVFCGSTHRSTACSAQHRQHPTASDPSQPVPVSQSGNVNVDPLLLSIATFLLQGGGAESTNGKLDDYCCWIFNRKFTRPSSFLPQNKRLLNHSHGPMELTFRCFLDF